MQRSQKESPLRNYSAGGPIENELTARQAPTGQDSGAPNLYKGPQAEKKSEVSGVTASCESPLGVPAPVFTNGLNHRPSFTTTDDDEESEEETQR